MIKIDPENPPAKIVYVRDGSTVMSGDGWTLNDERALCDHLRTKYNFEAADGYRPMCIVRLKAWK